jgi:sugar/nucleoside kinase (ribokinase family)
MYEDEGVRLSALLQRVKEKGIATSLDMAEVEPGSEAGMLDWKKILTRVLPFVDFFAPSFKELCFMIDRKKYEELVSKAGNEDIEPYLSIEDDIEPLARMCLKMGAGSVLIKCGAKGLYFMASSDMDKTGKRLELCADEWNGFCGFEKSYKIDRVLSGTGAGDTCIAAFLASILEGAGPKEAMENAAATGALCCMSVDAVSGLPKLSDVRNRINAGWEKAW